jgi:hypothetical protein
VPGGRILPAPLQEDARRRLRPHHERRRLLRDL